MANPSERHAPRYNYGYTQSLGNYPPKTIANTTLCLRLCEILQNDNNLSLSLQSPPY